MSRTNAKNRMVNSKITSDAYFQSLDAFERLVFLILLVNNQTNVAGIYEAPITQIAFDSGLECSKIKSILEKFSEDGKIYHINGYIIVVNFLKHQSMNDNMIKGAQKIIHELPISIVESEGFKKYSEIAMKEYPMLLTEKNVDPLEGLPKPSKYSDSNLDRNINNKETISDSSLNVFENHVRKSSERSIAHAVGISCTGKQIDYGYWFSLWGKVSGREPLETDNRCIQIDSALQILNEEDLEKTIRFRAKDKCWKHPDFAKHKTSWDSFWGSKEKVLKWYDKMLSQSDAHIRAKADRQTEAYARGYGR